MADYSISTVITADSSNFDKNVKKAGKSLDGFSSNIKSVTKLLGGLFAVTSMVALAKSIKEVSTEFSKATSNIAKGTGATGKALQNLSKSVNNAMRNGVGRSASEVGSMVADLNTRFGVTDKTLERMVDKFDMFASVTDTDVKTSINGVADLMAKWNVSLEDSDKLLDQLTIASQMSGASVTELSAGLKTGQSVLSQFGMSLTESTAFLASLSKNGVATGTALTGLRTALANFSADGKEAGSAFKEVAKRIKNAKTQTEALQIATETFGARSGAEMVKVLQSSATSTQEFTQALINAGGALENTDRASRNSQDALDDLKATIQATFFSSGADTGLRDMIDGIAEAFRNINFDELKEQFSSIGLFLKGVWEQFKELFNNIKEAIDISGTNFGSWKEVIYNHLNAVYRVLQDWVGGFSALLKGDFSLAWDYVKLAVMRTADYMLDTLSKLANSMPDLINKIIDGLNAGIEKLNEGLALIGQDPIDLIGHIDHVDLSDALGLDESIKELEKKIEQATGKVADKTLKDLKNISSNVKSTTKEITSEIGEIGDSAKKTGKKIEKSTESAQSSWEKLFASLGEGANDWSDVTNSITDGLKTITTDTMESLGASLIEGEDAWDNYGTVALKSIAGILEALAMQLAALAAVNYATWGYDKAVLAMGASAVALAGAGALKSMASRTKEVSDNLSDSVTSLEEFKQKIDDILSGATTTTKTLLATENLVKIAENAKKEFDIALEEEQRLYRLGYDARYMLPYMIKRNEAYSKYVTALQAITDVVDNYNNSLLTSISENEQIVSSYKDMFNGLKLFKELELKETAEGLTEIEERMKSVYATYEDIARNAQLIGTSRKRSELYEDLTETGLGIGEALFNAISEGADKSSFLSEMKESIKKQVIELTIYTEEFTEKLADVGVKLSQAMLSGIGLDEVVSELDDIWVEAEKNAKKASEVIEEAFGGVVGVLDEIGESVESLGENIADSLIDGLSNGLSQSDFLQNMYEWIRKLIIQTVVYTESMKSEIEAIGKAISDGLASGFTEDSLHEIRRDLSYIFYSANKQMEGIDDVLSGVFSGYASGTENATRGLHLVGEAGPELVAFNGGEKVYNAEETSRMLNGGNNFNVTFNNTQDTTAFAMVQQLRQYNREMAINGIF